MPRLCEDWPLAHRLKRTYFGTTRGSPAQALHARKPPPLSHGSCMPWELPALLPCPLICHLPQHILWGSAPAVPRRTFIWICWWKRINLFGSVSSGVYCYGKRIVDMQSWRAAFIVHMWRWRHRIWSWVLLQNKGLNFDLQSRELYFNHDFIKSFILSAQSPQKGFRAAVSCAALMLPPAASTQSYSSWYLAGIWD